MLLSGKLTGFSKPEAPLLSEYSLDELATTLSSMMIATEKDLERAEILRRIINLKQPALLQVGHASEFSDWEKVAGAGTVSDLAAGGGQYTEDAIPSGYASMAIPVPTNRKWKLLGGALQTNDTTPATFSVVLRNSNGDVMDKWVSETVNNTTIYLSMNETGRTPRWDEIPAGWDINIYSNIELQASVFVKARIWVAEYFS